MSSFKSVASSAMGAVGTAASKAGELMATMAKATTAAVGAAAAGLAALTKSAVGHYADYEQLVGGVETLFKDSDSIVMGYAEEAYKNAGLSANAYMETITSFSASLIQSLGGDTKAAAEIGNQAIVDMSDNANKMGTDMAMIQNAYQGFAKGNYTMLDNLKLGYGGTASEMARLINDSGILGDEMINLADKQNLGAALQEVGFARITQAIHIMQERMGIAGTTQLEAASTISGSIGMMKAAWENFLTGMANPDADFSKLTEDLVNSIITVADNLIPRIVETVPRIVDGLMAVMGTLSGYMPEIISSILPALISGAASLVASLMSELPALIQQLIPVVVSSLQLVVDAITSTLGIASVNVEEVFNKIGEGFSVLWNLCQEVWASVGQPIFDLAVEAFTYIAENWDTISATMKELFQGLWDFAKTIWDSIAAPMFELIGTVITKLATLFDSETSKMGEFISTLFTDIKNMWDTHLKPCFEAIGTFITETLVPAFQWAFDTIIKPLVDNVFSGIIELWDVSLKPILQGICDFITGVFQGDWEKAFNGISSIVSGVMDGLVAIVKKPINGIIGLLNDFIGGVNKIQIPDWVPGVGGKNLNIPKIPLLAKGGNIESSGAAIVGEAGPELLHLPKGAKVSPLDKVGGNNNITQNNYFTTRELSPYETQLEVKRLSRNLAGAF